MKTPLVHNDATNENHNKKVRQCSNSQGACHANPVICDVIAGQNNLADTQKVNQDGSSTKVVRAPYQASNETHSTARHNTGMLSDNAGAASAKVGAAQCQNLMWVFHHTTKAPD